MAASTNPRESIANPTTAEARACLLAVIMAEELGFHEIQIEGDALMVIRKLNLDNEDKYCIRTYIQEIKRKSLSFRSIKIIVTMNGKPPRGNVIKINFDASFNQEQHTLVAGIVARNDEGLVMAASTNPGESIANLTTAEARACLLAVILAEELDFHEIQIEGDALTVIRKLNLDNEDRSCIRTYIQEIKRKSLNFQSIEFKNAPRAANRVAHGLALEGQVYNEPRFWMEEVPRSEGRFGKH
ncbi:reverse transcriptase [Gossypium australe]|uniref:Reverse transcriptase n=1 Tax=Gossypium australe TaxID=47621 RepID=A0A5B6VST6_9ROSI|nr:reverse transcriptase [Gossypium australe]